MSRHSRLFALTAALAASVALPAHADMMFNRIATFSVADNLPQGTDKGDRDLLGNHRRHAKTA